jgi:hypothetical protein
MAYRCGGESAVAEARGSLWHSYRRGWATARKDLPISDVALAGGWTDATTLLRCYQQPDDATLLRVMSEPRKILEAACTWYVNEDKLTPKLTPRLDNKKPCTR